MGSVLTRLLEGFRFWNFCSSLWRRMFGNLSRKYRWVFHFFFGWLANLLWACGLLDGYRNIFPFPFNWTEITSNFGIKVCNIILIRKWMSSTRVHLRFDTSAELSFINAEYWRIRVQSLLDKQLRQRMNSPSSSNKSCRTIFQLFHGSNTF